MTPVSLGRPAAALAAAALGAAVARRALAGRPPGGAARWDRVNHAGGSVTLLEGPAWVLGAAAGAGLAGAGPALATLAAGAVGAVDDLAGDASSKGLAGHLRALARGEVTTGSVKILGLAGSGLLATALADARAPGANPAGLLLGGALVAGTANLVNLFDLRPGRALKVVVLVGAPLAGRPSGAAGAAAVGASLAVLPDDLAGRSMLGDTGANAAGALLGAALLDRLTTGGRSVALLVVAGLTVASERVSFTRVIETTPGLRQLDALGRPPR